MEVKKLFKETLTREKPSPEKDLQLKLRQSMSLKKSIKNRNLSINPGTSPLLEQKSVSIGGRSGNRTPNNHMTNNRIINNYSSIKNNQAKINDNPRANMTPQAQSNRMSSTISYF